MLEFSACYFQVEGLNPQAYAWRKKMAERSCRWPETVDEQQISQLIIYKIRVLILLPMPGERKWQKEARYIMAKARGSSKALDISAGYFKVNGLNPPI